MSAVQSAGLRSAEYATVSEPLHEGLRIAGEKVERDETIDVVDPYSNRVVGTVPQGTVVHIEALSTDAAGAAEFFADMKHLGTGTDEGGGVSSLEWTTTDFGVITVRALVSDSSDLFMHGGPGVSVTVTEVVPAKAEDAWMLY